MAVLTELSEKVHFYVAIVICDAVNFNPYKCQRSTEEFIITTLSTLIIFSIQFLYILLQRNQYKTSKL